MSDLTSSTNLNYLTSTIDSGLTFQPSGTMTISGNTTIGSTALFNASMPTDSERLMSIENQILQTEQMLLSLKFELSVIKQNMSSIPLVKHQKRKLKIQK